MIHETTESRKEKKACLNAYFQYSHVKITELNKIWSLKRLAMLKYENRTSIHTVRYSDRQALFWCIILIILKMNSLDSLFLCFAGQQVWLYF